MFAIPFGSIPVFNERCFVAPGMDGDGVGGALWRPLGPDPGRARSIPGARSTPGAATTAGHGPMFLRKSAGHQQGLEIVTTSSFTMCVHELLNSVSYSDLGLKPTMEVTSVSVEIVSPWSKRNKKVIVSSLYNTGLNCCPLNCPI